jgi:hypothetical protein
MRNNFVPSKEEISTENMYLKAYTISPQSSVERK